MGVAHGRLGEHEYDRLREATRTHREELLVRLCGEAGLRAGEIARLRPDDLDGNDTERGMQYFLTVREADGGTRPGYLPSSVAHDLVQYIRSNAIGGDEEVIGVTERRIQMLVGDVGERAAELTGRAVFETVTPSTLRAFFARRLLVEDGVDVRVVTAVGGWDGIDSVLADLGEPTRDEIAAAFEGPESTTATGRLSELVGTFQGAIERIVGAESRAEIERSVCEELTGDPYRGAWILEWGPRRERVTLRTHAGESADRFEGAADTGIVRRALQTGRPFVAPDDPGPAARQEGSGLLAAVPLEDGDTQYGALVVRAGGDAFDDPERALLATVGRQIAFAISAVERKQVLLGGSVLEVQFSYDGEATLVALADRLDCSLVLEGAVPDVSGFLCFLRVVETAPKAALEAAAELAGIADSRLIRSDSDDGVLEVDLRSGSPLLSLVDRGGTVTDLRVADGQAQLTCELSPEANVRSIHDDLNEQFPSLELQSKREQEATRDSLDARSILDDRLTEKQRTVIRTAFHAGYFEWPRESTAEDLAESMGVSPPTLHNHLRKAQQKLLERIIEHG